MDENGWDKSERRPLEMLRATTSIFVLVVYCLAIAFLTACAITIVVKLIFWPPCTDMGKNCVVDPWSVVGLTSAVLGVAATVLAILGAIAVAAWWGYLDDRVAKQVTKLYSAKEKEINKLILKSKVTKYELEHLRNFDARKPFLAKNQGNFIDELKHLFSLELIERQDNHGFRSLQAAFEQDREVNVKSTLKSQRKEVTTWCSWNTSEISFEVERSVGFQAILSCADQKGKSAKRNKCGKIWVCQVVCGNSFGSHLKRG